jgi:crotonobetainyl-CoA:carnitine CoA-transferase CaiB-like acyl-CoA transferase
MPGPLAGIRIVDVSQILSGPDAAAIASLRAEGVIP